MYDPNNPYNISYLDSQRLTLNQTPDYNPMVGLDEMENPYNASNPIQNLMSRTNTNVNLPTPISKNEVAINNTEKSKNNGNFWGVSSGMYGSGMLGTSFNELYSSPYYLHNLGRSVVGKTPMGILGAGVGTILSGARDFMSGAGAQNIQNFLKKEYQNRQTRNLRSNQSGYEMAKGQEMVGMQGGFKYGGEIKFQEGGSIEQQPNPQEIIASYAQKMGYNESQMNQLMQNFSKLSEEEMSIALEEMMALQGQMQEGGKMQPQPQGEEQMMMEIMSMISQALQSGANPEQILQQLINEGISEETAVQIIQQVMAQMQGGMQEQGMGEALEEQPMEQQPMMKKGGKKKGLIMLY